MKSENIAGHFNRRWTEGYRLPDSMTSHALYYDNKEISWDFKQYSVGPDPDIILYYKNEAKDQDGIYVFNGHKGTDAKVRNVALREDTLSTGKTASDGIVFPLFYDVHWSSDAAYVVLKDISRAANRWQRDGVHWVIIDVTHARVVPPGWIIPTNSRLGSLTAFSSHRTPTKRLRRQS